MNGQGSPISVPLRRCIRFVRCLSGLVLVCCAVSSASAAELISLRLQIAWGGPTERLWRGVIRLANGSFTDMALLGLDADLPGDFVNQEHRILVSPRRKHRYSGLEVTVSSAAADWLEIELTPDLQTDSTQRIRIPLAKLKREGLTQALAGDQMIRVARAAGDELRVSFKRDALVFSPGERVRMDLRPNELDIKAGAAVRARFRLKRAAETRNEVAEFWNQIDDTIWALNEDLRADSASRITPTQIELPIPESEGVYDLEIDLVHRPLNVTAPIAKRSVQFVVIDSRQPPLLSGGPASLVTEFNPANPKWFDRLMQLPQWRLLPRAGKGPWSNRQPEVEQVQGKSWVRLESRQWVAYSLPVGNVNVPHILEIEFPTNVSQNVGISILEANVSQTLAPVSLNSGVSMGDPDLELSNDPTSASPPRHRLVFWPRTNTPVVVISNQDPDQTILFGRIRLEAFEQGLPTQNVGQSQSRQRIAVFDRPLVKEVFLAKDAFDDRRRFSFDDWLTFYQSGRRMVEYLRFAGYDGVALGVAAEGSTLYPSKKLNPTPRYDRGILANTGQDPIRKDVLEMLFRIFDREGLVLIPSIEFATPLPELERELAKGRPESDGIELTDARGRSGIDVHQPDNGLAPYYNPLEPRVQAAMLSVVDELVTRYGTHASFGGVNLNCTADGFSHFPDRAWGLDRKTLVAFAEHASKQSGSQRPEQLTGEQLGRQLKAAFNQPTSGQEDLLQQWIGWRADQLSELYRQMAQLVRDKQSEGTLFLSTIRLSDSAPWQRHLRPTLQKQTTAREAMLAVGADSKSLSGISSLVMLRPNRIAPLTDLAAQASDMEIVDFENASPPPDQSGSQFSHELQQLRLDSFDTKGPFDNSDTVVESYFAPAGSRSRSYLAHSLALHDDRIVFDGGISAPMGQEASTKSFFDVFRQLPNRTGTKVDLDSASPIVVRVSAGNSETFAYFVNDSPWTAGALIEWKAPADCRVTALGTTSMRDRDGRSNGYVEIEPYGLIALRFDSDQVTITGCRSVLPLEIAKKLLDQYDEILARAQQVMKRQRLGVLQDPGFENSIEDGQRWVATQPPGGRAIVDGALSASGNSSLLLWATTAPVSVTSHEFPAPATGRLILSFSLRAESTTRVPLRVTLETTDPEYQPSHTFEGEITDDFREFVLRFSDVPEDPELELKIKLELFGPGKVWVDDIQLYDKYFKVEEQTALERILYVAYHQQSKGDLAGCYETLSGYWPRFLLRHVPPLEVASRPQPLPLPPKPTSEKLLDRVRRYIPRFRF